MRGITKEEFITRARKIHGDRYDYSRAIYKNLSSKIAIRCPIHGDFHQSPKNHVNGNGCPACGGVHRRTQKEFIRDCNTAHRNKYDYTKAVFKTNRDKITITCPEHGEFSQIAGDHLMGKGCRRCSLHMIGQDQFIKQCRQVHGNHYDYSNVSYTTKHGLVTIGCPHHGTFEQSPHNHLAGKGCNLCKGGVHSTTANFIEKAKSLHGDLYDYSSVHYKNSQTPVDIICATHGVFQQKPTIHINHGCGCPECNNSYAENLLFETLGGDVIRNNRRIIKPLELDGYFHQQKVAVEYCGLYWHSELQNKGRNYHRDKFRKCADLGINLITVFEDEWINRPDVVINRINHALGKSSKSVGARKCTVSEINRAEATAFLNAHHLQGYTGCKYRFGLFLDGLLVSVMTFAKPSRAKGSRHSTDGVYELSRFASSVNVVGGGSKLLKYFERTIGPTAVYTYADLRWGNGDSYTKMGFTFVHDSKPNYWYFKDKSKRYHRFGLRKNSDDDQSITEWENRQLQGWNRIWDCGHRKFIKRYG